jgi:hypothetical protein
MKTFQYQYTKLIKILIYAAMLLCVAGFGLNLYQVIVHGEENFQANQFYTILRYGILFLVTVLLFVILVSLLIKSCYTVSDKYLKSYFGFIISKYEIKNIEKVMLERSTDKLTVLFKDNQYVNIVIAKGEYEDFVNALLAVKSGIAYEILSKEPDDFKPKK